MNNNCMRKHIFSLVVCHQCEGLFFQEALARSFEREFKLLREGSDECYFIAFQKDATRKRDKLVASLKNIGLTPIEPQGGYFILADIRNLMEKVALSRMPGEHKDFTFVKWLARNAKLQGIPPSAFFSQKNKHLGENYIRLCFLKVCKLSNVDRCFS